LYTVVVYYTKNRFLSWNYIYEMSVVPYDVLSLAFPGQFMVFFVFVYLSHSYQFVSVSSTVTTTGDYHFIKRNDVLWLTVLDVSVHDYVATFALGLWQVAHHGGSTQWNTLFTSFRRWVGRRLSPSLSSSSTPQSFPVT
jgi:hypothetical protein